MLAGWEALDRGSLTLAWKQHEIARSAAREASSSALLAYATGQQAFVLIELEMFAQAVQLLEDAGSTGRDPTEAHGRGLVPGDLDREGVVSPVQCRH